MRFPIYTTEPTNITTDHHMAVIIYIHIIVAIKLYNNFKFKRKELKLTFC